MIVGAINPYEDQPRSLKTIKSARNSGRILPIMPSKYARYHANEGADNSCSILIVLLAAPGSHG